MYREVDVCRSSCLRDFCIEIELLECSAINGNQLGLRDGDIEVAALSIVAGLIRIRDNMMDLQIVFRGDTEFSNGWIHY